VSRSEDKSKEEISEVGHFILKGSRAGMVPIPIEPNSKENIEVYDPTPVKFSWKPVPAAAQYHIVVERHSGGENEKSGTQTEGQVVPIIDRIVKETTLTSQALADGNYSWRVSALDSDGQEGPPCRTRDFKVIFKEEMAAPKLKAPVVK
jgi:hypothetical protein